MNGYERAYALMEEIYNNFSEEDKKWFLSTDTTLMHNDLGRHLRNHAGLWQDEYTPLMIDGVDHSHGHPDAISARVLRQFQENKKRGYS